MGMDKTSLGDRMKDYEAVPKAFLMKRTPAIIRLDGRAFHTFCRRDLKKFDHRASAFPFSSVMHKVMVDTTCALMEQIQGAVFAYTQSDEISILLRDWDTLTTQGWFGGNIQKIVSVGAAIAATSFTKSLILNSNVEVDVETMTFPTFDARVFNLPKEEVCNYFIWRQQDSSRNSVQMVGHFYFSQKEMHGLNNSQVQDLLMAKHAVNWDKYATWMKRGTTVHTSDGSVVVDEDCPIFTAARNYIERFLTVEKGND